MERAAREFAKHLGAEMVKIRACYAIQDDRIYTYTYERSRRVYWLHFDRMIGMRLSEFKKKCIVLGKLNPPEVKK